MRVIFDARHLQTVSRTRGIGRYSRNLLAAFARRARDAGSPLGAVADLSHQQARRAPPDEPQGPTRAEQP